MGNIIKRISYAVFTLFLCAVTVLGGQLTLSAYAETSTNVQSVFESTEVLDDLQGATIGGTSFDISDYPHNDNGQPQLIAFTEFCYSYSSDKQDDYALYVYVYNPQDIAFDTTTARNKIQITYADKASYSKYYLQFVAYSKTSGYEGRFYKFKVVLTDAQKSAMLKALDQNSRVYTISGIELSVNYNVTEYAVGQTYTYSGYALGYGSSLATESTLSCTVDGLDLYLSLDVHSTYYRPSGTNGEAYARDTLHSVYFSVPNSIIDEYGEMTAVHATWLNALTNPVFVTGNSNVYNAVLKYIGQYVHGGSYQSVSDDNSNNDLAYSLIASKRIESASWNNASYGSSYMSYNENRKYTVSDKHVEYLQYCFLADGGNADNYILPAETLLGNKADGTKGYFETYTEEHGGALVDDRYSQSLFESVADSFTDIIISADDKFTLTDEVISQSLWQKFVGGGYNVSGTNTYTVSAIKRVESSDFKSTAAETCAGLYIDESDYTEFRKYYNTATSNAETVYLFRYCQSEYTHYEVAEYARGKGDYTLLQGYTFGYDYIDTNAYFMQMWVQLGFDIIDLTFTKNNVETVIPAIMSPMDLAADGGETLFPTSDNGLNWWQILLGILGLIIIIWLLIKFLPWIVYGLIKLVALPFKAIGKLFKSRKERRQEKERKAYEDAWDDYLNAEHYADDDLEFYDGEDWW